MSRRIIAAAAILACIGAATAMGEEFNPVIGKVGEITLRETDLDRLVESQPAEIRRQMKEKPELKVRLVEELLLKQAIAARARKEGFDRKPETREKLAYLVDDFLSREYVAKVVVAGVKVPESELEKYYQEHVKEFIVPESVKARHVFLKVDAGASVESRVEKRKRAEELLQRLKKGEDFARVAAEASEDGETAQKGGELGSISPGKTNSEDFEQAALSLKSGELSNVVATPYGLHIIRVDERSERRTATLAETREYIAGKLQQELELKKGQEFVDRIVKESGLEVYAEKITGVKKVEEKKP